MPLEPAKIQDPIRFGEGFELDFEAYALRRSGRVVRLERIPMEILLLLVEHRGEIVSREQIVERIWGKEVFLDTDNSINGAVRKVRKVLKDDPEQPRFIQTITGKGYRFIAPVLPLQPEPAVDVPSQTSPERVETATSLEEPTRQPTPRWQVIGAIAFFLIFLVGVSVLWLRWHKTVAPGERVMLAVLPFENLTGDPNQEYFSDGLTEEMITELGRLNPTHLGVIGRSSIMLYKRNPKSLDQVGRELGVQYVLEGSIRRDTRNVRVTAQLIQVKDQTHVWAREYDRELSNLLMLQSEVAGEISDEILSALGSRSQAVRNAPQTLSQPSYEAHEFYLKGLYSLNKRSVDGFHQAISYFQQAIAKDPNYARAYAGVADCYALLGGYSGLPQMEFMEKARAAALRALQLDPNLPEAHTALALVVENYDHDWQTAQREYLRAIELNPNYSTAHQWYAEYLTWLGRFDEALSESDRARRLDPLSLIIACDRGAIFYYSRQYDRALEHLQNVSDLEPNSPRCGSFVFQSYLQKGMFPEAVAMIKDSPDTIWYWSRLTYFYGRSGQTEQADRALRKLQELTAGQQFDALAMIEPYIGLGKKDEAFAWLEKAYEQHSNALTGLKVDPLYDPLRSDPRFQGLLQRVGFVP